MTPAISSAAQAYQRRFSYKGQEWRVWRSNSASSGTGSSGVSSSLRARRKTCTAAHSAGVAELGSKGRISIMRQAYQAQKRLSHAGLALARLRAARSFESLLRAFAQKTERRSLYSAPSPKSSDVPGAPPPQRDCAP